MFASSIISTTSILLIITNLCIDAAPSAGTIDAAPWFRINTTTITGHYKTSHSGNRYEAYEGIPYAQPPVDDLRFEHPEPITYSPSSQIIANATRDLCLQMKPDTRTSTDSLIVGDEDCLYLNLYTPLRRNVTSKLHPVIVYFHGGAFMYGAPLTGMSYYLIDRDVIIVSVYYRLGVLGFLSTEDDVVPGNLGLKDQSLAMRWIRDNAVNFGGDPERITLTGLSAGGASVHYHYLSPMSRGLFRNGMSFSGTALNCWTRMDGSRQKAKRLAQLVGCPSSEEEGTRKMVECFKRLPGRTLVQAQAQFMPWRRNPFTPFGPVVEPPSPRSFIDRPPLDIINSGGAYDAPWITSVASEEGLYPVSEYATSDEILREIDENWVTIAPYLLDYNYTIPRDRHATVAEKIRKEYVGDRAIGRESLRDLVHLVGDRIFSADAAKAAMAQAKVSKSPVWFYYYSYRSEFSLSVMLSRSTEDFGVCHSDDVLIVIMDPSVVPNRNERDMRMRMDLVKVWTSFASDGAPKLDGDAEWSRVDGKAEGLDYLYVAGPGDLRMKKNGDFARIKFWSSVGFDENVN